MSTTPTELLETAQAHTIGIIGGADGPTAVFVTGPEGSLDIESIKSLLDGFDPASLLPDLSGLFGSLETLCRIAVMIGPLVLLALGLAYLFLAPKEANYYLGYRCYFGMGSEYAWRFTQRLAGWLFTAVGLTLTVVMFAISVSFNYMQLPDMVWKAASCLVVELIASVALILTVNLSAMYHFDRKGKHRRKRK